MQVEKQRPLHDMLYVETEELTPDFENYMTINAVAEDVLDAANKYFLIDNTNYNCGKGQMLFRWKTKYSIFYFVAIPPEETISK
jgi:hypothetical protein